MKVNYQELSSELMRSLRGPRSQVAFSRRLGFKSNLAYSWESGRRWPGAHTFFAAASRSVDVNDKLQGLMGRSPAWLTRGEVGDAAWVSSLLQDLRGHTPIRSLAEQTGRSRFAIARWLKGQAEPRLPDFLQLIDATSKLLPFVGLFADPATLPSIATHHHRAEATRDMAWRQPWSTAVLLALELEDYRALPEHDPAWLAGRLGLPEAQVETLTHALLASGQVRRRAGKLMPTAVQNLTLGRPGSGATIKQHWAEVAASRLGDTPDATSLYNVFTVSAADLEQIRELQRAHYRAIRALLTTSSPADRVVLLNTQLLPLDRLAPPQP